MRCEKKAVGSNWSGEIETRKKNISKLEKNKKQKGKIGRRVEKKKN